MVLPTTKLRKCCSQIEMVLTDVDGVLTDGGMYYTSDGDIMKKFHVRDGMGVNILRRNGIPTIIITKEKSKIFESTTRGTLKDILNQIESIKVKGEFVIVVGGKK